MTLLVRYFNKRHRKRIREQLCMGISHQEAGHITPVHCSWAGADTHGINVLSLHIGKQPARKLRQAFDMRKNGIGLTETQLSLLHRQQSGTVYPIRSVEECDGCCIITGVNTDYIHTSPSVLAGVRLLAKEPRIPLTNAPVSSPSYFFARRTASEMATPVGTSSI